MVRRDYSGMTLITPDSPNYNRGVLYGVLNAGITEILGKDISLKDLKDVSLGELENDDALMYNKDTEKRENTDLERPVEENISKYLNESVIDGGRVPTPGHGRI